MRQILKDKIDNLKEMAEGKSNSKLMSSEAIRIVNDNLSKSIRTRKDAEIFKEELNIAFQLANK